MSLQSVAILLHLVTHYAPDVSASRIRLTKTNRTTDDASDGMGSTASCLYECGAREVSVEWEREDESDGSVHSMSSSFSIGSGARITYKPKQEECLSRCQVVGVTSRQSCGKLHGSSVKVSKNAEYKLCCVPRMCNFDPKNDVYEPHQEGDGWWQGIRPYNPLTEIKGTTVAARTCLCCNKEREKMKWDSRVKSHCKQAYVVSSAGNMVRDAVRLITIKTTDVIHRARCRSYCKDYPKYPFAMRSKEARSIVAHTVKSPAGKSSNDEGESEADEE